MSKAMSKAMFTKATKQELKHFLRWHHPYAYINQFVENKTVFKEIIKTKGIDDLPVYVVIMPAKEAKHCRMTVFAQMTYNNLLYKSTSFDLCEHLLYICKDRLKELKKGKGQDFETLQETLENMRKHWEKYAKLDGIDRS